MDTLDEPDTIQVLAAIKAAHPPQEVGEATIRFWVAAFRSGQVTNVADAIQAVIDHYSTPGASPWVIPGDIIGRYREIRRVRVEEINDGDLTPDLDPFAPMGLYLATHRARFKAVQDGMLKEHVVAAIPPSAAIEASK